METDSSSSEPNTSKPIWTGFAVFAQAALKPVDHLPERHRTRAFVRQLVSQVPKPEKRPSYTTTLHLKVRPEAWAWLDQAAREVNEVWNWANAVSRDAVRGPRSSPTWLSAIDLDKLAAGAAECFARLGSAVIQRVIAEFVTRRLQFKKTHLKFRHSGGPKRALGWIPFKAENLRVNGNRLTFFGKTLRLFQMERFLEHRDPLKGRMRAGNFAQDALGEWYLNVTCEVFYPEGTHLTAQGLPVFDVAPNESVGIDPGLKTVWTTSRGQKFEPPRFYRDLEPKIAQAQKRGHKNKAKRLHRKVKRQREDWAHKTVNPVIQENQNIYLGNVPHAFLRAGNHAKSAYDSAHGLLTRLAMYKGHRAGRTVKLIDEKFTTATCSTCGALEGPRGRGGLPVRQWRCSGCGARHDRDVNGAVNLEKRGANPAWGHPSFSTTAAPRCESSSGRVPPGLGRRAGRPSAGTR